MARRTWRRSSCAIDVLHPGDAVGGDGQRVEDEDVRLDLPDRLRRRPELVDGAAEIRPDAVGAR